MATRLTKTYGFNPGFGMQTTNVDGGTETIFHLPLSRPEHKKIAGAPDVDWAQNDDLLLLTTKTCNRISRLEVFNLGSTDVMGTFFFAFMKDNKICFPRYDDVPGNPVTRGAPCYRTLATTKNVANTAHSSILMGAMSRRDLWGSIGAGANDGSGGIYAFCSRVNDNFNNNLLVSPQQYPNIGALMDATLRPIAPAGSTNGLAEMSAIDVDVIICLHLTAALPEADAEKVFVKIGIIETDISARNETEEYVKSWSNIPTQGVYASQDGFTLNYNPALI